MLTVPFTGICNLGAYTIAFFGCFTAALGTFVYAPWQVVAGAVPAAEAAAAVAAAALVAVVAAEETVAAAETVAAVDVVLRTRHQTEGAPL